MRPLICACRLDVFAKLPKFLPAQHRVVHLVWLNVFQFVNVEALVISFDEQADRTSHSFPTGRIQAESGQIIRSAKPDQRMARLRRTSWVGVVFDARCDDFEACADDFNGGPGVGCHQRDDVRASGALLIVVGDAEP